MRKSNYFLLGFFSKTLNFKQLNMFKNINIMVYSKHLSTHT